MENDSGSWRLFGWLEGHTTSHSIVSNELVTHKENNKGVVKTYDLTADSKLEDVSIAGYKIVHKKVLKEKNGWRTLVLIEYKNS